MERNYNIYNPEIVDSLIQVDNIIDKTRHEIKELEERRKKVLNDPKRVEDINEFIKIKKADLARFEQARKEYKAILEQCQDQRDKMGAYWGLGKAWFVEKKYQEALVNFEKCLELAEEMRQKGRHLGSFPSYVYYVGLSHFHVGNRQEARRYLDRAMQLWKEAGSTSGEEFKHAEEVLRKIGR